MIIDAHDITLRADLRQAGFTPAQQALFFGALDKDPRLLTQQELDLLDWHQAWREQHVPAESR